MSKIKRFFKITQSLHLDLQLLLANRCGNISCNNITSKERLNGFIKLAHAYK